MTTELLSSAEIRAALRAERYEPVSRIGRGAFGEVWLALRKGAGGFQLPCAIKVLHPRLEPLPDDVPSFRELFAREARILVRLRHPNIVQVLDFFNVEDLLCLVMEYVEGLVLSTLVDHRRRSGGIPIPLENALEIAAQLALGLDHAHHTLDRHQRPLLHQDIKPANVILERNGSVQLLDFGVTAFIAAHQERPELITGTPQYMSPEQASGGQVGPKSDLYSLGMVLYELLTLEPLIRETDLQRAVSMAASLDISNRLDALRTYHPPTAALLEWLLCPDPAGRPETGQELAAVIREILGTLPRQPNLMSLCQDEWAALEQTASSLLPPSLEETLSASQTRFLTHIARKPPMEAAPPPAAPAKATRPLLYTVGMPAMALLLSVGAWAGSAGWLGAASGPPSAAPLAAASEASQGSTPQPQPGANVGTIVSMPVPAHEPLLEPVRSQSQPQGSKEEAAASRNSAAVPSNGNVRPAPQERAPGALNADVQGVSHASQVNIDRAPAQRSPDRAPSGQDCSIRSPGAEDPEVTLKVLFGDSWSVLCGKTPVKNKNAGYKNTFRLAPGHYTLLFNLEGTAQQKSLRLTEGSDCTLASSADRCSQ